MAMLSMGHGVLHGAVPFVDTFEQRGPYMYFLMALTYVISPKAALFGLALLESVNLGLVYLVFFKTARLFYRRLNSQIIALIGILVLLLGGSFHYGGSPEEFVILPVVYIFYLLFKSTVNDNWDWSRGQLILSGIAFGYIFWLKYILIGYIFSPLLMIFIYQLIKKHFKKAFLMVFWALIGFFLASVPVFVYYLLTSGISGLSSLWDGYFIINLRYSHFNVNPLIAYFVLPLMAFLRLFIGYYSITLSLLLISIYFLFDKHYQTRHSRLILIFSLVLALIINFAPGRAGLSYLLVFCSVMIELAICACGNFWYNMSTLFKTHHYGIVFCFAVIFALILIPFNRSSFNTVYNFSSLKYTYGYASDSTKERSPYLIGQRIKRDPGSLMVYGELDQGYFYWSNQTPKFYEWESTVYSYSHNGQALNMQYEMLAKKSSKYVVMYDAMGQRKTFSHRDFRYVYHKKQYLTKWIEYPGLGKLKYHLAKTLLRNYRIVGRYVYRVPKNTSLNGSKYEVSLLWQRK